MEDILASIKKVIAEDVPPAAAPREGREDASNDDILDLDEAIPEPEPGTGHEPSAPAAPVASLMAEEAASGARSKLEALADAAANAPAGTTNPLEEVVREMLRPMLKQWLDERLPGIVDEHVRSEISRITGRKL